MMALNISRVDVYAMIAVMFVWLAVLIAYPILTLVHCIVLKRKFGLWLLNLITLFSVSFFWAISMLVVLPKQKALSDEIVVKKKRLAELKEQIPLNEKRLKEVEATLKNQAF